MSSFGLDSTTGFLQKTVSDILSDIEADERTAFGNEINVLATSVFGQLNGVFGSAAAENWEVLNEIYQSFNPNAATGAALDRICALTGVTRLPAVRTSFLSTNTPANQITLTGDVGKLVPAGRVVSATVAGDRFASVSDVTLAVATIWVATTAYSIGDIRSNGGNIYQCTTAGTSAGSGGPTTEDEAIPDNTVVWRFVGNGLAFVLADFQAEEFGPISAVSAGMTIETPLSGWSSAKAMLDGEVGRAIETDAALRLRRSQLLRAQGAATVEAIAAALADITGVTAKVYENDTFTTDTEGRPPKSIECVVSGGTDAEIAAAIFASKAAGILTFGFAGQIVTEVVVDSQGINHTINFTRPATVDIYIDIAVDVKGINYEGDAALKAALAADGNTLGLNDDVIVEKMQAAAFGVAGVFDLTSFIIDTTAIPPGTNTVNIPMTLRQQAVFDTARIDVVSAEV